MSEFDRDPSDLEFQEEAWDNEAELREDEDEVEPEGWIPDGFTEILIPEMLAHHCELLVAVARTLLGVLLQPCDRVAQLVVQDMDWARELVRNVAEILSMCWSAARTEGYPQGHPDALKAASKHLEWAISNGVVSWEELTNAYWLSILHSSPGAGDSPEDKLFWGTARKVSARQNRPASDSGDPVIPVAGSYPKNAKLIAVARELPTRSWKKRSFQNLGETIKAVRTYFNTRDSDGGLRVGRGPEVISNSVFQLVWDQPPIEDEVDLTWGMSTSWFPREERVSSMTVRSYEKDDPRRVAFWFKEIETKDFSFWVPEGQTEKALFNIIRRLEEPLIEDNKLVFRLSSISKVEVEVNKWGKVCAKIPSVDLLLELAGLDDALGALVKLAQQALGRRDRLTAWRELEAKVSEWAWRRLDAIGTILTVYRCPYTNKAIQVGPVEVRIKGKLADSWAAMLPPPPSPVNQLPAITLTCHQCHKPAKSIYVDGLCHACHRSANPL